MGKYAKNRNDVSRDTLYEEAIQLIKEQGKIVHPYYRVSYISDIQ